MMRIVIRYATYALAIGIVCAILAFIFSYDVNQTFKNNLTSFSGNLFLNVVAEFLGLAVGGIFAALIAKDLAKQKLEELAPVLVKLIGHLRIGGTISGEAARDCVICAVKVISEDSLDKVRSKEPGTTAGKNCLVCALPYEIKSVEGKGVLCKHCNLDSKVWDDKKLEEALLKNNKAKA